MAAPTITSVTPSTGSIRGGTSVALVGTGFTGATAVKFGAKNATSFNVVDDTHLTAVAPVAAAGQVDITVTNPTGTSVAGAGDKFTYSASYSQTGGSKAGNRYFQDVEISPATVKDGTLAQRFDPVQYPSVGHLGSPKVGKG